MKALPIRKGNGALAKVEAQPILVASMKALPKRKGNHGARPARRVRRPASMKAPPKRKGNAVLVRVAGDGYLTSMKASPKRKGNRCLEGYAVGGDAASMKVPTKKVGKGKWVGYLSTRESFSGLNEILHLKVQNKRSSSRPGVVTTVCLLESPHNKVEKSAGYPSVLQPAELSVKVSVRKRRNLLITANSPWTTYLNESPSEKEGK